MSNKRPYKGKGKQKRKCLSKWAKKLTNKYRKEV